VHGLVRKRKDPETDAIWERYKVSLRLLRFCFSAEAVVVIS
jgi:hypothetical protein